MIFSLLGAALVSAIAILMTLSSSDEAARATVAPTFAFQPFTDPDATEDALLTTLGEEIAFELRRHAAIHTRGPDARARTAGVVVTGSSDGQALRLVVIDNDKGGNAPLLQRSYDVAENFQIAKAQIARDIAELAGRTVPTEPEIDPATYRNYLVASASLRESLSLDRLAQIRAALAEIVTAAPRFARAYSRLCNVELRSYRRLAAADHFAAAERRCHRALTLDDRDWEVMLALADLYRTAGRQAEALDYGLRAEQLQPGSGDVARTLARVYSDAGQDEEAFAKLEEALTYEPDYWVN